MMDFDPSRTLVNVRNASTEDLLCRATVERDGMEPEALAMIDLELERRGVSAQEQAAFLAQHADCLRDEAGLPLRCSFCFRPAHETAWAWHRLWGMIPVFPRVFRYCRTHAPAR